IIMAGKAHPEDTPAKELIKQVIHFSRREDVKRRFVFLEDYDMNVARWMVTGVDIWLNTPRRYLEASGTSGMKVNFNGGLNLSILDGWWDEAYEPSVGWAIGRGEVYSDPTYQDDVESAALYDLLEKEIIPTFYDRDKDGRPRAWLARMKEAMLKLCPAFSINRMVREYATRAYFPAQNRYFEFLEHKAKKAKELAQWKGKLQRAWRNVQINSVEASAADKVQVGDDMRVRAWVHLGELSPEDVAVQIYHGPIDQTGNITEGEIVPMIYSEEGNKSGAALFSGAIRYFKSGRHGFTVRIVPHHDDLSSPFETGQIHWASDPVNVTA
ncbi:MAG: alpha-glucan family phosphorylase, partial [Terriglobales bacterium]